MSLALSFDQAPPISVPFRFFLTAPLFGLLAGLLALVLDADSWGSRWTPGLLALTHLLTTGFMLQTMLGALLQMLPVAIGTPIRRPILVANVAHPLLVVGSITLSTALLTGVGLLYWLAIAALAMGFVAYFAPVSLAVFQAKAVGPTVLAFRLAAVGFVLTALLGGMLAAVRGGFLDNAWLSLSSAHVGAGWAGWGAMLVVGAAYLVVPMFQLTPAYPPFLLRWLAPGLGLGVALWVLLRHNLWADLLVLGVCLFAIATLRLQQQRRRKLVDASFRFWQFGMGAVLMVVLIWFLLRLGVSDENSGAMTEALGVCVLLGVFGSVICGMLYKIVPFISWLHLDGVLSKRPTMNHFIGEKKQRRQLFWHVGATMLLGLAPWFPVLAKPGGLALMVSSGLLEWNLWQAARLYRSSRYAGAKGLA